MIILPDKNKVQYKFLIPVEKSQWRSPSQAMKKDQFGNDVIRTKFVSTARLNDGHIVWKGVFEDREDMDAFAYAVAANTISFEHELWDLSSPSWSPYIGENLNYSFAVVIILTDTAATSYTIPSDYSANTLNMVHVIGAGGGGGGVISGAGSQSGGGGGGGAYARRDNPTLTAGASVTIKIGAGGIGGTTSGTSGSAGSNTYFNGTAIAGSTAGAQAGGGGGGGSGGAAGTGGTTVNGSTTFAGGSGAVGATTNAGRAGGGSGGPNGIGGNASTTTGGTSDGGLVAANTSGNQFGTGFGSAGGRNAIATSTGGDGLNYGGGAGAGGTSGTNPWGGGTGGQGIIVFSYEPLNRITFNNPILGL